jgi:RNA polymerase sigma-70 factor, ECF subfamily
VRLLGVREFDSQGLRALQKAHGTALLAYFARRIEPQEDAAILFNELLLVVWRRAASAPSDPEDVRMWMFGIARKLVLGHHRSRRRQRAVAERLREELSVRPPEQASDESLAVRQAIQALPGPQRELVRLIHWDGFSITEAAKITGVGASTARSRYFLARRRLAAQLSVTDGEPPPVIARSSLSIAAEL